MRAGTSLAQRVFEGLIGTPRQREFEQALRSAVSRLAARYPRIGSTSADIDFFDRPEVVECLFAFVVLGADGAAQPISSALGKDYEASALLQGVPVDQVIAELAVLIQEELVAHGTFADQFTHRNTQEILKRLEGLAPLESDAVRSLRGLRDEILRGPLGSVLDPELRQREQQASLALPRPGQSVHVEVRFRFAFPQTPDGERAREALERSIAAGHPLSLAGSYIELAKVTSTENHFLDGRTSGRSG